MGAALDNPALRTEGKVTLVDGVLATAVLVGLLLNAVLGWWWADPAAGYVLVFYGAEEALHRARLSRACAGVLLAQLRRSPTGDPVNPRADNRAFKGSMSKSKVNLSWSGLLEARSTLALEARRRRARGPRRVSGRHEGRRSSRRAP